MKARNRDLFKRDALAARDVAQAWVLSLLVLAALLALILLLAPQVEFMKEDPAIIGRTLGMVLKVDAVLLSLAAIVSIFRC